MNKVYVNKPFIYKYNGEWSVVSRLGCQYGLTWSQALANALRLAEEDPYYKAANYCGNNAKEWAKFDMAAGTFSGINRAKYPGRYVNPNTANPQKYDGTVIDAMFDSEIHD
jgi:hypothetical protein